MSGILFVALACLCWALDTLIRYPLLSSGVSAEAIVLIEHGILSLFFLPKVVQNRKRIAATKLSTIFYFFVIGGVGSALATLAFTKAFSLINPSVVILLQKLQPVVAISLAYLLLGEKIGKKFLLWSVLCLAGSLLIGHKDILNMNTWNELGTDLLSGDKFVGYGYAILAVVSWGSCTVFGKKLMKSGFSETDIMAGRFFMGFLILIPLMVSTPSIIVQSPIVWGKIFLMVALSGALGMGLYYKGLGRLSARSCSLAELFFPVAAVGVNWIFLNASLDAVQLLGAGLLLLGSTVIQIKHY